MSRYHRWSPSRRRTIGLLLVILLLVSLDMRIGAQPLLPQQAASETPSPTSDLTATAETPSPTCEPSALTHTPSPTTDLTATAETPSPTCEPSALTHTPSPTSDPNQLTPSITASAFITSTTPPATPTSPTPTDVTPTSSPSAIPSATATPFPTTVPVTPQTSTPIPTPSDGVMCVPGTQIAITGEGPPRTALLLLFRQRIVGGDSTDAGGRFEIPLVVGRERAGYYPVAVQVRGTKQVLLQFTCIVPEVTPTPPMFAP
jgi:hypothetical protein